MSPGESGAQVPAELTPLNVATRVRKILVRFVLGDDPGSERSRKIQRICKPARLRLFMMPVKPSGDRYAYGRGQSVDRRYIENFLSENRAFIKGRCLEIGDARYTKEFGSGKVQKIDILDIDSSNVDATIIGDLQDLSTIDDGTFDCVIVTQVLQYIPDPSVAVAEIRRILAPGGSALLSVPTMAPTDHVDRDIQRFMPTGVKNLFAKHFDVSDTVVNCYGNLLTGLAYWTGLAQEDLPRRAWMFDDPTYPVIITVRVTSPQA
jgi:SAM-dependent methyltransferase